MTSNIYFLFIEGIVFKHFVISYLNMFVCLYLGFLFMGGLHTLLELTFPNFDSSINKEPIKTAFGMIFVIFILINAYITAKYFNLPFGHASPEEVLENIPNILDAIKIFSVILIITYLFNKYIKEWLW